MSSKKGKMVTCCRCENWVFLEFIGKEHGDGGYTTWDKFEELPEGWLYASQFGDLCPECAREFKTWVNEFFNGKVAPSWKIGGDR